MRELVEDYVRFKRRLGYRYIEQGRVLRKFADSCESRNVKLVSAEEARIFALDAPSPASAKIFYRLVRLLALYASASDPRHEVPPSRYLGPLTSKRPLPFIYAERQISELMDEIARNVWRGSIAALTYRTMIGLLAATGLRLSEAINLELPDFAGGRLHIRQTKFKKERYVPLHPTTISELEAYLLQRRQVASQSKCFFVGRRGNPVGAGLLGGLHRRACVRLGWRSPKSRQGPRIHDLRHTFATRSLESCGANADDVNKHMTALSTYLGHSSVENTYWYLEATPVLLREIASKTERTMRGHK